jgi:hypothetical protein
MLQPSPVKRVQFYSRNPHTSYVDWLLTQNGITTYKQEWYDGLVNQSIRSSVDDIVTEKVKHGHVEAVVEETPSWVDAAFDVLKDKVEDVTDAIEEFFDDDSPPLRQTEEEVENEIELDEQDEGITIEEEVEESTEETAEEEIIEEIAVEETVIDEKDNPFGGEMDYNSYTVRELQKLCRERSITIRGTKSEVVLRLRRDDMGIVEQPTQADSDAPSQEAADEKVVAPSQEAASKDVTQHDDSGQEQPDNEEE